MLSYPLKCGLLQQEHPGDQGINFELSYPLKCGLLQPSGTSLLFELMVLSYPLKCGLLQRWRKQRRASCNRCHTHSNVGFCNYSNKPAVVATVLSYPLKCGLLQRRFWVANKIISQVVIPTQMWASATTNCFLQWIIKLVVIPTQMWASATWWWRLESPASSRCHTHSNVGFCNLMTDSYLRS